jgi:hypothetical protein
MYQFIKTCIVISSVVVLVGCGGGGGSDTPSSPPPTTPPPPSYSLFAPPSLPIASENSPEKIDYNVFKIDFTGKTYVEFTTTQTGEFLFSSSGYGYNESKFELYEYGTNNVVPFSFVTSDIYKTDDPLPAGRYTMKIYNDKTPSTGAYVSLLSNSFQDITLAELPMENGYSGTASPSFLSFWKFNVTSDKCIRVNGSYQYVYLYDSTLNDTGLDLDNNTECLQSGTYYMYFRNHTQYDQPFELVVN